MRSSPLGVCLKPREFRAAKERRIAERRRQPRGTGRSLVVLPGTIRPAPASSRSVKPSAVFVAQLIATALDAPQTRARRRAEPGDGLAAYNAAMSGPAAERGKVLRSL